MKKALKKLPLPRYLATAFLRATPEALSKDTGAALETCLRNLLYEVGSPATVDAQGAASPQLRGRWEQEGGSLGELDKLLSMVAYRRQVLHRPIDTGPFEESSPAALCNFWVSSGHDVEELSTFLLEVDNEAADWLPG